MILPKMAGKQLPGCLSTGWQWHCQFQFQPNVTSPRLTTFQTYQGFYIWESTTSFVTCVALPPELNEQLVIAYIAIRPTVLKGNIPRRCERVSPRPYGGGWIREAEISASSILKSTLLVLDSIVAVVTYRRPTNTTKHNDQRMQTWAF